MSYQSLPGEIERPLGLDIKRPPRSRLALPFERQSLLAGIAAIGLLAASTSIAMRDRPFRIPAEVVVTTPTVATPEKAGATAKPAAAPADSENDAAATSGPSIIKVDPGADTAPSSNVVVIRDPSAVGQDLRVAHLPDKDLVEQSATGPLPIRAADGRRPFDVYARPWSGTRGARVALVIGGLGVSQTGTQEALARLPAEVTVAFASGGNSIGRWMQKARQDGHEVVMQVPLEPFDYPNVNPGKNTLTTDASPEDNIRALHWSLSRTTNYVGIVNYMGARFSADSGAMTTLMAELGKRGLMYLDDGSSARTLAPDLAPRNGVPLAVADAAIDAKQDRGEILKKLDQLEQTARAKGFAVGTGSAFAVTVDTVSAWINEARQRGIEIVPISAVAVDPERK